MQLLVPASTSLLDGWVEVDDLVLNADLVNDRLQFERRFGIELHAQEQRKSVSRQTKKMEQACTNTPVPPWQ